MSKNRKEKLKVGSICNTVMVNEIVRFAHTNKERKHYRYFGTNREGIRFLHCYGTKHSLKTVLILSKTARYTKGYRLEDEKEWICFYECFVLTQGVYRHQTFYIPSENLVGI